jgi:hypothetical protein
MLRKIPSRIANRLISRVTRFPINDLGCTLKAIRREIAQELELYGEMHRFIPILAHQRGARCAEVVTKHHPRTAGKTKYGIDRTVRVILDLVTVKAGSTSGCWRWHAATKCRWVPGPITTRHCSAPIFCNATAIRRRMSARVVSTR